ncbi:MAG: MotA/TolQ/ExbB proton channel family protein [Planctomycetota bacterium]|nr:MotA/TolQ/ExbB proton channel family protein [Planctomycetota bacterium]
MNNKHLISRMAFAAAITSGLAFAQGEGAATQSPDRTLSAAAASMQRDMKAALAELSALRKTIGTERLPLAKELSDVEAKLSKARGEFDAVSIELVAKTDELTALEGTLTSLQQQSDYLSTLLRQYNEEFASRLHIAEMQRYQGRLDEARLSLENDKLDEQARLDTQLGVVEMSLDKLEDALGGSRFEGKAKVDDGQVKDGRIVLLGPMALFQSVDLQDVGALEEDRNSLGASVFAFPDAAISDAAARVVQGTGGKFPVDVTLGDARKVESINETWWEHVQKGGPIMIPMAILAGAALLVVLLKWLSMVFVRRPGRRQLEKLFGAMDDGDHAAALEIAEAMPGPGGRMLAAGAAHSGQPRELIEEVMFEKLLTARLKLQSWLPFVSICATSAPLLGLLGTVTGIMGTFALMTEFGGGDPKVLSSGISEALVTTENGLIIAIPSLLLHAFLSRKAKAISDGMEKAAVQFMNHVRTVEPAEQAPAVEGA